MRKQRRWDEDWKAFVKESLILYSRRPEMPILPLKISFPDHLALMYAFCTAFPTVAIWLWFTQNGSQALNLPNHRPCVLRLWHQYATLCLFLLWVGFRRSRWCMLLRLFCQVTMFNDWAWLLKSPLVLSVVEHLMMVCLRMWLPSLLERLRYRRVRLLH